MSPTLARRQQRAFERLYRKHVGDVYRYARALREELDDSLTCHEAEFAISRQLDNRLARTEKRLLRAHIRACAECDAFARCQREQRAALRALAAVPLPDTLQSFFGGGGPGIGVRSTARLTAVVGTTVLVLAVISAGGVPHPSSFIGQKREPEAGAGVKREQAERKFSRSPASP
jgi:hypothetical protein